MPPKPLPPLEGLDEQPPLQGDTDAQTAYQQLLPVQDQYDRDSPVKRKQNRDNLVKIRILGWMLVWAPCPDGRNYVVTKINDCANDPEALLNLGNFYLKYFVNCFQEITTTRPSTAASINELAMEELKQAVLIETPRDHTDAKKQALLRDDFCCVATKCVDATLWMKTPKLQERFSDGYKPGAKDTTCAHILPKRITRGVDDSDKHEHSSNVFTVLSSFGGLGFNSLIGHNLNRLDNILTLEMGVHRAFDKLEIWFEPIENKPNCYTIHKLHPIMHQELLPDIQFTTTDLQLPLPNPRYLALHAACAKVLHMSGAAEVIDRILEDHERTSVLANDGSSSELLTYLLFGAEIMVR